MAERTPELPRRVRAGGHHAALVGPPADGEGLAAQRRVVQFFDRAEEGVQVEVQDGAGHGGIIEWNQEEGGSWQLAVSRWLMGKHPGMG